METYIKKMTEIVKEHYEANHESIYPNDVRLQSCSLFNNDVRTIFHVGVVDMEMCLYEVIYFSDYDGFRVSCYKLNERFNVYD